MCLGSKTDPRKGTCGSPRALRIRNILLILIAFRDLRRYEHEFKILAAQCEQEMQAFNLRDQTARGSTNKASAKASWEDVLDELDRAKDRWEAKTNGKSGVFRNSGRYLSGRASYISPWLDLLPSSDYGSIVCGGLKLIIGVRPPLW